MSAKQYVSVAEAAKIAGVTPQRIRQLCQSGALDAKKLGELVWLVNSASAAKLGRQKASVGRPRISRKSGK